MAPVVADDVNRIQESNKNNNRLSQTITVGGGALPDLVPTSLSYDQTSGLFTSVVRNQGNAATPSGVVIGVAYSVDGVQRTWGYANGPLAPGASVTIGTQGGAYAIPPTGTHTIAVVADDVNRIQESNKSNNTLSQTLATLPDLIPTSISYAKTSGLFTSVVLNQGNAPTPNGVVIGVAYLVDGAKCTWGAVNGPLGVNASVTIGTQGGACPIASGTHTITVFADDAGRMSESNKTNNKLSQTIQVP
jgi:subtilase family serine protease